MTQMLGWVMSRPAQERIDPAEDAGHVIRAGRRYLLISGVFGLCFTGPTGETAINEDLVKLREMPGLLHQPQMIEPACHGEAGGLGGAIVAGGLEHPRRKPPPCIVEPPEPAEGQWHDFEWFAEPGYLDLHGNAVAGHDEPIAEGQKAGIGVFALGMGPVEHAQGVGKSLLKAIQKPRRRAS